MAHRRLTACPQMHDRDDCSVTFASHRGVRQIAYSWDIADNLSLPDVVTSVAGAVLAAYREISLMRIAQIAPLTESIPPKLYGGTERVVSWLTEELVAMGHDVTLFASGDSRTSARLEAMWPRALRLDGSVRDPNALHMMMLERIYERAAEFDFLHFHLDYYPFSLFSR